MIAKPAEIYQGSDWLTYRWSVAQAFDTLDRIRDLCLQMPVASGAPPGAPGSGQPGYDVPEEEVADVFGYIAELCDDLTGELDAVHADLFPVIKSNAAHMWLMFEVQQHVKDLHRRAAREAQSEHPAQSPPDAIVALAARVKTILKQIDQ